MLRRQQAGRQLFEHDNAMILPQFPRQLIGAGIDRIDTGGAAAEQHIGEAAGGGADIDGDRASHVPAEMGKTVIELDAAARHPGMVTPLHLQRRIRGQRVAGLGDLAVTGKHQAGHHQRLRAGTAFNQPAFHQQLIDARLHHAFCSSTTITSMGSLPTFTSWCNVLGLAGSQ